MDFVSVFELVRDLRRFDCCLFSIKVHYFTFKCATPFLYCTVVNTKRTSLILFFAMNTIVFTKTYLYVLDFSPMPHSMYFFTFGWTLRSCWNAVNDKYKSCMLTWKYRYTLLLVVMHWQRLLSKWPSCVWYYMYFFFKYHLF